MRDAEAPLAEPALGIVATAWVLEEKVDDMALDGS